MGFEYTRAIMTVPSFEFTCQWLDGRPFIQLHARVYIYDSSSMSNIASSGMVGRDKGLEVGCPNHGLRKDEFTVVDIGTDGGDCCAAPLVALRFPRPEALGGDVTPAELGLLPVARVPRSSEFLTQFVCCCWKPS